MSLIGSEEPGIFFLSARATGLKGWVAFHSWVTYYSQVGWIVLEITNRANLRIHRADPVYCPTHDLYENVPTISMNRVPDASWFGNDAFIWGKITPDDQKGVVSELWRATSRYPYRNEFRWLTRNCNSFVSWLIYWIDAPVRPPFSCIGARSKAYWRRNASLLP